MQIIDVQNVTTTQAPPLNVGTSRETTDMLSQAGAMQLAKRLERYWHERDYPAARFWIEPIQERFPKIGTYEMYAVKCNLVNGMPPRYRDG